MRQHYQREDLDRLLTEIKKEYAICVRPEDQEKFKAAEIKNFVDLCDIVRRAAEICSGLKIEEDAIDFQSGKIGAWDYCVSGSRFGCDLTISGCGGQLDVQSYEDGYKIMFCGDVEEDFVCVFLQGDDRSRRDLIAAIAYFVKTKLRTPSLAWVPDPEVYGWPKEDQENGWW